MSLPSKEELLEKARAELEAVKKEALKKLGMEIESAINKHLEDLEKVKERFLNTVARTSM